MLNPMQMMQMMSNPMQTVNSLIQQKPELAQYWNMVQQMSDGKSPEQMQTILNNVAKQKGIDLQQVGQMFQQFIGNMKF